ncbi:hypothetical protein [Mycoplasma zalophidermidis]|uniref:Uncharacterized protein n=1 Tax=Mycoplasma zalophidermidis TaxID=398174 RepID=A0ABS6DR82_9MOLU|nr:hypothetical protein [Mycoplasma zalophidermidis]MBU4689579.1 hypothetical protein [Mycoplasma zalophidermidis]MBU4693476.1 hypothetical protein [Mycoplasma zalophidermidis]MCR8966242.1 hypothetical protein [Mycoplasma zalophidermidis]
MNLISKFNQLNQSEVGSFLSSLSFKKQVYLIDCLYKQELIITFKSILSRKFDIPLSYEDIYNEFLLKIPLIIKNFRTDKGASFKTFLISSSKFFCLTKINYWLRNKRKINISPIPVEELFNLKDDYAELNFDNFIYQYDIKLFINNKLKFDEIYRNMCKLENDKNKIMFMTGNKKNDYLHHIKKSFNCYIDGVK